MCYIEMSVVYGLFVSWNQQEGAVMCWGHSDDSGQRPWVVLISVCVQMKDEGTTAQGSW